MKEATHNWCNLIENEGCSIEDSVIQPAEIDSLPTELKGGSTGWKIQASRNGSKVNYNCNASNYSDNGSNFSDIASNAGRIAPKSNCIEPNFGSISSISNYNGTSMNCDENKDTDPIHSIVSITISNCNHSYCKIKYNYSDSTDNAICDAIGDSAMCLPNDYGFGTLRLLANSLTQCMNKRLKRKSVKDKALQKWQNGIITLRQFYFIFKKTYALKDNDHIRLG